MVTDEERDYMYRTFAVDAKARINLGIRRRLAPLMKNDFRKIELMNALLLSLPGTPIVYYGDEIAMGDNYYLGDRNGVRTPMQWSADRNAGFSRANPQSLYLPVIIDPEYHYETAQCRSAACKPAFAAVVDAADPRCAEAIHCFRPRNFRVARRRAIRKYSRSSAKRRTKRFSSSPISREFRSTWKSTSRVSAAAHPSNSSATQNSPRSVSEPYVLSLGPHGFYWFCIGCDDQRIDATTPKSSCRSIAHEAVGPRLFTGGGHKVLCDALDAYLRPPTWFAGKAACAATHRAGRYIRPRGVGVRVAAPIVTCACGVLGR